MSKLSFLVVHLGRDISLIDCIHFYVENLVAKKSFPFVVLIQFDF